MGNDISEGAKIGIILIILCALVGIVFALLTMMKNITNQGSSSLQNGLEQLSDSEYQDYDQKVVSGTQVLSALKIFEGRQVSFVIITSAMADTDYGYNYGALLDTADSATPAPNKEDGSVYAINKKWEKEAGKSYYVCNQKLNGGVAVYNMNTKPTTSSGTKSFVRSSAKFLAELILDETGTKVGVIFTQQN